MMITMPLIQVLFCIVFEWISPVEQLMISLMMVMVFIWQETLKLQVMMKTMSLLQVLFCMVNV